MGRPGFSLQRRLARRRQEARASPDHDAPAPGFWQRFDAGFARARSLAFSTVVLLVLGVVGWSLAQELIRDPVIIEPLAVPESLAKAGWTGEVLARQIRDGIRDINEAAEASPALAPAYLFDWEQLDFALPGGLVSIRTLVTVVRGVLRRPVRRVTGELVQLDDDRERQALRRDPDLANAYNGWGNALVDLKRPEEAIGKFQEALLCDPDYADAYYGWGNALLDLWRPDEAAAKFAIYQCLSDGRTSGDCLAFRRGPRIPLREVAGAAYSQVNSLITSELAMSMKTPQVSGMTTKARWALPYCLATAEMIAIVVAVVPRLMPVKPAANTAAS